MIGAKSIYHPLLDLMKGFMRTIAVNFSSHIHTSLIGLYYKNFVWISTRLCIILEKRFEGYVLQILLPCRGIPTSLEAVRRDWRMSKVRRLLDATGSEQCLQTTSTLIQSMKATTICLLNRQRCPNSRSMGAGPQNLPPRGHVAYHVV